MDRQQFLIEFQRLHTEDEVGLTALAARVRHDADEPVQAVMEFWLQPEPGASRKAMLFLQMLEDLAVAPLTRSSPDDLVKKVWAARTAVRGFGELRGRIVSLLDSMLPDRRHIPEPAGLGPMEGKPPSPRVCDEAYLLMRQLLNPRETMEQQAVNQNIFLSLPQGQKDQEIQKARKSREWSELVESVPETSQTPKRP